MEAASETAALELFTASLFKLGRAQLTISGALTEQMVGDVQDVATDYEGGVFTSFNAN